MSVPQLQTSALLSWIADPRPDAAVRFAEEGSSWRECTYAELADATRRTAAGLAEAGVQAGDTVVIVEPTGARFIELYFGAMLAGAIPVPTTPPAFGKDLDRYGRFLRHLIDRAQPRLVATSAMLAQPLSGLLADSTRVAVDDQLRATEPHPMSAPPAELAMLQFTSGSTGPPRGVRVPFRALEANVAAITAWLRMGPADPTASWLPMHHDMGLIGCLITPIVNQTDLWLLSPDQFVRSPSRYLRCFGEYGARLTAMPTFGLEHIARRVRPADLAGMDFSQWRAVIVGAERVGGPALENFFQLLAPHGLSRRSLLPAYGLAEATLAVTGLALEEEWTALPLDAAAVELGKPAPIDTSGGTALVGSGRPLAGIEVEVVDDELQPLPDDAVGEIVVRGACLTDGYHRVDEQPGFGDGYLATGDAGFLHDGQLFVLGRLGDSLKLRGRTLLAEDVEAALEASGLPRHRQTVLLGMRGDRPTAVLVVENADEAKLDAARKLIARLTEGADVEVVRTSAGSIPRTTSGKPQRRQLWKMFNREAFGNSHSMKGTG